MAEPDVGFGVAEPDRAVVPPPLPLGAGPCAQPTPTTPAMVLKIRRLFTVSDFGYPLARCRNEVTSDWAPRLSTMSSIAALSCSSMISRTIRS
jgi:hypothetical protein